MLSSTRATRRVDGPQRSMSLSHWHGIRNVAILKNLNIQSIQTFVVSCIIMSLNIVLMLSARHSNLKYHEEFQTTLFQLLYQYLKPIVCRMNNWGVLTLTPVKAASGSINGRFLYCFLSVTFPSDVLPCCVWGFSGRQEWTLRSPPSTVASPDSAVEDEKTFRSQGSDANNHSAIV